MKNRASIKFERTATGVVGSIHTADTFLIARGNTKRSVRKELIKALTEF